MLRFTCEKSQRTLNNGIETGPLKLAPDSFTNMNEEEDEQPCTSARMRCGINLDS
jgi:hypothetical protein